MHESTLPGCHGLLRWQPAAISTPEWQSVSATRRMWVRLRARTAARREHAWTDSHIGILNFNTAEDTMITGVGEIMAFWTAPRLKRFTLIMTSLDTKMGIGRAYAKEPESVDIPPNLPPLSFLRFQDCDLAPSVPAALLSIRTTVKAELCFVNRELHGHRWLPGLPRTSDSPLVDALAPELEDLLFYAVNEPSIETTREFETFRANAEEIAELESYPLPDLRGLTHLKRLTISFGNLSYLCWGPHATKMNWTAFLGSPTVTARLPMDPYPLPHGISDLTVDILTSYVSQAQLVEVVKGWLAMHGVLGALLPSGLKVLRLVAVRPCAWEDSRLPLLSRKPNWDWSAMERPGGRTEKHWSTDRIVVFDSDVDGSHEEAGPTVPTVGSPNDKPAAVHPGMVEIHRLASLATQRGIRLVLANMCSSSISRYHNTNSRLCGAGPDAF